MPRSTFIETVILLCALCGVMPAAASQAGQSKSQTPNEAESKRSIPTGEPSTPQPLQPPYPGSIRLSFLTTVRQTVGQLDNAANTWALGSKIEFAIANLDAQQASASAIAAASGKGEAQVAEALRSYAEVLLACPGAVEHAAKPVLQSMAAAVCTNSASFRRHVLELTLEQNLAAPVPPAAGPVLSRHGDATVIATAEKVVFALEAADSLFDAAAGDGAVVLAVINARASVDAFAASAEALKIPKTVVAFRACIEAFDGGLLSTGSRADALAMARRQLGLASSLLSSYRLLATELTSLDPPGIVHRPR